MDKKSKVISVINSMGGMVYSKKANSYAEEVNLTRFSKGIYYAKIVTSQNSEIKKIIIH